MQVPAGRQTGTGFSPIMTQHPTRRLSREPSESIEDKEHIENMQNQLLEHEAARFGPFSLFVLGCIVHLSSARSSAIRKVLTGWLSQIGCTMTHYDYVTYYVDLCRYFDWKLEGQNCSVALASRRGQRWESRQAWHQQLIRVCQPAEVKACNSTPPNSWTWLDHVLPSISQLFQSDPND